MILIPIDPSISCTGVAAMENGEPIRCAQIKPKTSFQKDKIKHTIPAHQRIEQIIEELAKFVYSFDRSDGKPIAFAIEITSGKTAKRFGSQRISGLGTYGMVVGQIVRWCIEEFGNDCVFQFYENDWTRGSTKERRQEHCRYAFPYYAEHWYEKDKIKAHKSGSKKGGDVSDAIMLGDYAIQKLAIEGAIK